MSTRSLFGGREADIEGVKRDATLVKREDATLVKREDAKDVTDVTEERRKPGTDQKDQAGAEWDCR